MRPVPLVGAVAASIVVASAAIVSIGPYTTVFTPTNQSRISITFITGITVDFRTDLSVGFSILKAGNEEPGEKFATIDLVQAGHSSTGTGNFTLQGIPLTTEFFLDSSSGAYIVSGEVKSAYGHPPTEIVKVHQMLLKVSIE